MFYSYINFLFRNPVFSIKNIRLSYNYKKTLKEYLLLNKKCAWCGRNRKLDVHHKIPVSIAPELACNFDNLITLCRKPACHFIIGHFGDWKKYNKNIEKTVNKQEE